MCSDYLSKTMCWRWWMRWWNEMWWCIVQIWMYGWWQLWLWVGFLKSNHARFFELVLFPDWVVLLTIKINFPKKLNFEINFEPEFTVCFAGQWYITVYCSKIHNIKNKIKKECVIKSLGHGTTLFIGNILVF